MMKLMRLKPGAFLALALPLLLTVSCGGGGGGTAPKPPAVKVPPSLKTPLPGQLVGNWEIDRIDVVKDTGIPHHFKPGMNLRFSGTDVEVLADQYIGPGSILKNYVEKVYKGFLEKKQVVLKDSFTFSMTIDYSPFFGYFFQTRISASGKVLLLDPKTGRQELRVDFLKEDFLLDKSKPAGIDQLVFVCKPGKNIPGMEGEWFIQKIKIVKDLGPSYLSKMDVTKPLVAGRTEVTSLFGTPWNVTEFRKVFPEMNLRQLLTVVGPGFCEGFIAFTQDTPKLKLLALGDFTFNHNGSALQGLFKMAWDIVDTASNSRVQDVDFLYLVLGRKPKPAGFRPSEFGEDLGDNPNPLLSDLAEQRRFLK